MKCKVVWANLTSRCSTATPAIAHTVQTDRLLPKTAQLATNSTVLLPQFASICSVAAATALDCRLLLQFFCTHHTSHPDSHRRQPRPATLLSCWLLAGTPTPPSLYICTCTGTMMRLGAGRLPMPHSCRYDMPWGSEINSHGTAGNSRSMDGSSSSTSRTADCSSTHDMC